MIIRDKQDLRKCVKQCVRRSRMIETNASASILNDRFGVAANLEGWAFGHGAENESLQDAFEAANGGSPFSKRASLLLSGLNAMQMPVHNLDKAEQIIQGFDRDAYLSSVLNAMRASSVLIRLDGATELPMYPDERFSCALIVGEHWFKPGRYGVDYESAARQITDTIHVLGVADIAMENFSQQALEYCLIPVCEDESVVMHVHAASHAQLNELFGLLRTHQSVRAIVSTEETLQRQLISEAAEMPNVLVQLRYTEHIPYALQTLGTRFIPYTSCAERPEEMIGGWAYAKEALWQALYDAYLLLARSGFELTRERIEADVNMLLCGNYEEIHA